MLPKRGIGCHSSGMNEQLLSYTYLKSPVGQILVAGSNQKLHYVSFPTGKTTITPDPEWQRDAQLKKNVLRDAVQQLGEYFEGTRTAFDLPLHLGGTPFQNAVWRALYEIPYGATVSYGDIALAVGEAIGASQAVGIANGQNPIPIIIPCHRVIGADGSLTGFGGGLETKDFLLALERRVQPAPGSQLGLFD